MGYDTKWLSLLMAARLVTGLGILPLCATTNAVVFQRRIQRGLLYSTHRGFCVYQMLAGSWRADYLVCIYALLSTNQLHVHTKLASTVLPVVLARRLYCCIHP